MPGDSGPCAQLAEKISESPLFSWMGTKPNLQLIMFGLEGAGKTTLLYKLKIPQWKRDDIESEMRAMKKIENKSLNPLGRDPAYHYEELNSTAFKYGIWEIPGNEIFTRMWPMFYRYVRMSAVLFVVDAFSEHKGDVDRLTKARSWIHFLLNEDELRTAAFVLILNIKTWTKHQPTNPVILTYLNFTEGKKEFGKDMDSEEKALYDMLGVPEIVNSEAHKERFFAFSCNCADFSRDDPTASQKWDNCLHKIKEIYKNKGEGSFWGR